MGTLTTRLCWYTCALVLAVGCAAKSNGDVDALRKENSDLRARIAKLEAGGAHGAPAAGPGLPASLDALYPPQAQQPMLTMHMIGMAMAGEAAIADVLEQDLENAGKSFEAFAAQYKKLPQLVPEWADLAPAAPVDELGEAIAAGNPDAIMPAIGKVGAVCQGCHVQYAADVQYKYHWKDTGAIEVIDPVTEQKAGYKQFMHFLSGNFSAVGADLAQGQKDAAVRNLTEFTARFAALEEMCGECHDSERTYYVGDEVKGMLAELTKEIAKDAPDPGRVQEVMMAIGHESCGKCHLVHMPAALWRTRVAQAQGH